ncbi:exosortase [Colwellia sp. Bg11-12]|uniref:exosortase n=1 Tax=Colwellia sp. Bg11-12 TaxID=2759817 RepID=UPI0015F54702|nr:exosortase [Colwellia sp. Bg11-12]MBA6265151.1 exosortase [Colwellia sp. Bg11-12]
MNRNTLFEQPKINAPFVGILILFTTICALNIPILITLWRHGFDDGTYSHAFLIPFISLYLYYELAQSGKLRFREKFAVLPTILLLLSCYLLFITSNAQISIGYWLAFLAVSITSVTMVYRFNWYVVFPAAFLIFIFPFWGVLVPLLQNISVAAVTYMMSFTGVPTYVEAEMITIPAGVFEIADGCSGLRYMIVSLAIGSLFIFLNIRDTKRAALFLTITILGALLTNWIRITALILIGEYTNMESSLMEDHNTFGWYLYVPFMILLFVWGNKLSEVSSIAHKENEADINKVSPNKTVILCFIALIVTSSTALNVFLSSDIKTVASNSENIVKPNIIYYSSVKNTLLPNHPAINYSIYNFNGADLDGKPTFYANSLIPEGWSLEAQTEMNNWLIYTIYRGSKRALVFVKYEIADQTSTNTTEFKVKRLLNALIGINNTKLHWLFISCENNCAEKIVKIQTLIRDL